MAVPKSRTSKAKGRGRQKINMRLKTKTLIECPNCGNKVLLHRVCPKCGFYRGRQVYNPEEIA
ncbi:MAG: 50S ribosomal protein L32 [Spirochaetales bacterium]|nr:50S ribosomal protein L32 [Spirochaetales bacterium]